MLKQTEFHFPYPSLSSMAVLGGLRGTNPPRQPRSQQQRLSSAAYSGHKARTAVGCREGTLEKEQIDVVKVLVFVSSTVAVRSCHQNRHLAPHSERKGKYVAASINRKPGDRA